METASGWVTGRGLGVKNPALPGHQASVAHVNKDPIIGEKICPQDRTSDSCDPELMNELNPAEYDVQGPLSECPDGQTICGHQLRGLRKIEVYYGCRKNTLIGSGIHKKE